VRLLAKRGKLLVVSSAWKSAPIGGEGPDFLNAAAKLSTALDPEELKTQLLRPIEAELGRVRGPDRFAPRTIDLDILVYADLELETGIWDFAYLALPISEIEPELTSRITGERISEAASRLVESQKIKKIALKLS
jgi:2-amino-4-hydroxy-6-hydroxymethyldihydropteridine diphosphokinase